MSSQTKAHDADLFNDLLIGSIHHENIELISHTTVPKEMWELLRSTHQRSTAGTRFYYIRQLMTSQVADNHEAITKHLIEMSRVAGRLRKLCPQGTISIDDLEIASMTASLPSSLSVVLSPFKHQDEARPKDAANAVRDELITWKNRANLQSVSSASASRVEGKSKTYSQTERKDGEGKEKSARTRCDYCRNFHGGKCHSREMDELKKEMNELKSGKGGKSQMAVDDSNDTTSDYSDTMARSAYNCKGVKDGRWNVDSGTTNCLVPPKHHLSDTSPSDLNIRTANNAVMNASHQGKVNSPVPGIPLLKAHAVNGLVEPLRSVADITDAGKALIFLRDRVLFADGLKELESLVNKYCNVLTEGPRIQRSYYVDEPSTVSTFQAAQTSNASMLTWHHRLSHLGIRGLQDLQRERKITVTVDNSDEIMKCEECIKGKLNRLNMKIRDGYRVDRLLGRVHSDLCELPVVSREGYKYVMTFIDEHSHYSTIYFMKSKKDTFSNFQRYVAMAEKETCENFWCVRSDNGGEYTSGAWERFCEEKGIQHSMGPPHSPQLNGVAERFNHNLWTGYYRTCSKQIYLFDSGQMRHGMLSKQLISHRRGPFGKIPVRRVYGEVKKCLTRV